MKALTGALASLAMVVALIAPSTAFADHGFPQDCGSQNRPGGGWYDLHGYNIACSVARTFAREFTYQGMHEGSWDCHSRPAGFEQTYFSCKRMKPGVGHQHVIFFIGS